MAKISERKPGRKDGGYTRLFGIPELGALISQVQATTISAGTELEKMIWERVPYKVENLNHFIEHQESRRNPDRMYVANKKAIKSCESFETELEPDFIAFKNVTCYVIEVKDGDTFDTKKAQGEQDTMTRFSLEVASNAPFKFKTIMCCFNAPSREQIHTGLKRRFSLDQCMTGKELCRLIDVNYAEIVEVRQGDCQSNLNYFVKELLSIPKLHDMVSARLNR